MTLFSFLNQIEIDAESEFDSASDSASLENIKAKYLGKNGKITLEMKKISSLDVEKKRKYGSMINLTKVKLESLLSKKRNDITNLKMLEKLEMEAIDVTLPGRGKGIGSVHPITKSWQRIVEIFTSIGFDVVDGPEIENDWTNFTALNSPENHPARSMQDTFYVDVDDKKGNPLLLRTHTSPMQVRYALKNKPPIKVIAPGKTYRVDSDATHSPMFHQVEGLWIDKDINFSHLKGLYLSFIKSFFEKDDLNIRFRPSYFPFTEPSAEIDISFNNLSIKNKWLEVSGAGQVHPIVLKNMGIDPEIFTGFAFGSGLERLTMLRYGVKDLRLFFEGDLRFLEQFI